MMQNLSLQTAEPRAVSTEAPPTLGGAANHKKDGLNGEQRKLKLFDSDREWMDERSNVREKEYILINDLGDLLHNPVALSSPIRLPITDIIAA